MKSSVIDYILCLALAASTNTNHNNNKNHLLILGLGRVGMQVAKQTLSLQQQLPVRSIDNNNNNNQNQYQQFTVVGTTTTTTTTKDRHNVQTISFYDIPELLKQARKASHLLITIPPIISSSTDNIVDYTTNNTINHIFDQVAREFSSSTTTKNCHWVGLISTTSVYGNHNGNWVNENSITCKEEDHPYLVYEKEWINRLSKHGNNNDDDNNNNCKFYIFRCAGIYCSNKSALHTVYKNGITRSTNNDSNDITNRIHVHDIASAIVTSMMTTTTQLSPTWCRIYNLADDSPESRRVVFDYAASLLQKAGIEIRRIGANTNDNNKNNSGRARRRSTDLKRISNKRLKNELLPILKYPTYKEGLQTIFNDKSNPWWKGGG